MARTRIDDLLAHQADDLASLEEREARRFLRAFEDARRDLAERLRALEQSGDDQVVRFTAQRLRIAQAQVEVGIRQMRERLNEALRDTDRRLAESSIENLLATIKTAEPDFIDAGGRIEHEVLRRITEEQGLLVHRFSVERYSSAVLDDIQRRLVLGVTTGETYHEVARRIAGVQNSVFTTNRSRAELVVRMELNSGYNRSHQTALQAAAEVLDDPGDPDPLLKRADEFTDLRNNAISRVLDGMLVGISEAFRVPVAKVRAEHANLNALRTAKGLPARRLGGIVWPVVDGHYVGMHQPAHYHDRGRITPWRESWGHAPVKKPRAPRKPKPPAPPPPPPPPRHSILLHEQEAGPAGSNKGGFYKGADGVRRYVKFYDDPAQAAGEHVANRLYRDLGLGAPKSELFEAPDGRLAYASELIDVEGTLGTVLEKRIAVDRAALARRALDGFSADVLTANWDAAGLTLDNIVVDSAGALHRIDNGGAFLARAQAGRKSQTALQGFDEWWRYFDASNPGYSRLAKTAGVERGHDLDIGRQVDAIVALRDRAGGWDRYVEATPGLDESERRAVVELLERRTTQLEAKRADWRKIQEIDALEASRPFGARDRADAQRWGNAILQPARGRMTAPERAAVNNYTGSAYRWINKNLRSGGAPDAEDLKRDAAIGRSRIPVDMVLYRGELGVDTHLVHVVRGAKSEGEVFIDLGYSSSTLVPGVASAFASKGRSSIVFRLHAPKGTQGLWVDDFSSVSGEVEVVNPRGTRVRILRSRWDEGFNHWVVDAELLPPS